MKKPMHTILMKEKGGVAQTTYKNVIRCETRFGCELVLFLATGETATYDADNWEMWDLTPCHGWNDHVRENLPVDETFCEAAWSNDDIRDALDQEGYDATEEQITLIRLLCKHNKMEGHMIAACWDWIKTAIENHAHELNALVPNI